MGGSFKKHTQRGIVNSSPSNWVIISSGLMEGSVWGLVLFNICINKLDDEKDTYKSCRRQSWQVLKALWKTGTEFKMLLINQKCSKINKFKFSRDKGKVIHLRTQMCKYKMGNNSQRNSTAKSGMEVMVNYKL